MPPNGGCDFVADPRNSALIQPIFWTPQVDPAAIILTTGPAPDGPPFTAEDVHAHVILQYDEALVRLEMRRESFDVALTALSSRQALAALLILDDLLPDRLTALARFWAAIKNRRAPADPRVTPQRQRRARLMLRVVDARVAGASYRQIAAQLFPNLKHDSETWVENPVRETTVRLARDGLAFVRGGYRKILRLPRRSR
ncbi:MULTISPECIES: DUF2285 domain-containing protein [Brevundimonas]|uniref:DUF2285 domain-containing protein n=1 Tax=Sphingobium yanoikuyae TaxID=13690 RepID=A0A430BG43_SPHYA|nr:DUF2285 domain-containing protein [Brevundimonas sp.]MCW5705801.1 DUF2285 domain-containing protein [Shinella sp.]RSU48668.1 DUF2285 domain-containing protein [Sphingobium yanoikuyae]